MIHLNLSPAQEQTLLAVAVPYGSVESYLASILETPPRHIGKEMAEDLRNFRKTMPSCNIVDILLDARGDR